MSCLYTSCMIVLINSSSVAMSTALQC
jgi:hypothetical protein